MMWNICATLAHSLAAAVSLLLFEFYHHTATIVYLLYVRCFKYKICSILNIQNSYQSKSCGTHFEPASNAIVHVFIGIKFIENSSIHSFWLIWQILWIGDSVLKLWGNARFLSLNQNSWSSKA